MISLTLLEATEIRSLMLKAEKRLNAISYDPETSLNEALRILERAMGMKPTRDMREAIQWDRLHPGEQTDEAELERRRELVRQFNAYQPPPTDCELCKGDESLCMPSCRAGRRGRLP